jgi:hypothetical protein
LRTHAAEVPLSKAELSQIPVAASTATQVLPSSPRVRSQLKHWFASGPKQDSHAVLHGAQACSAALARNVRGGHDSKAELFAEKKVWPVHTLGWSLEICRPGWQIEHAPVEAAQAVQPDPQADEGIRSDKSSQLLVQGNDIIISIDSPRHSPSTLA